MIDWKPCREGGVGAELECGGFRAYLWAWPSVDRGVEVFCTRVRIERDDDAKGVAADLLQLYLDGDPEERAFRAKLRAWVASP
jgi:hypothetical protein